VKSPRDPYWIALAAAGITEVVLVVLDASVVLVGFFALVAGVSAAGLIALLEERPTADELTARNPVEPGPTDFARLSSVDDALGRD
jgi:hypothetical protein